MACQLAARASTRRPGTRKHPGKPGKNAPEKNVGGGFHPGARFTKAVAEIGSDDGPEGPSTLENKGFRATLTAPVRPHRPGEPPGHAARGGEPRNPDPLYPCVQASRSDATASRG